MEQMLRMLEFLENRNWMKSNWSNN
jgi:hypothetical protein